MKAELSILAISVILCFAGCKKEKLPDGVGMGGMEAELNGEKWEAIINTFNDGLDSFNFRAFVIEESRSAGKKIEYQKEAMPFSWVQKKIGKVILYDYMARRNQDSLRKYPRCSFYTLQEHGEIPCESFRIVDADSVNNYIELTGQKDNFSEVWGNFSVTFYKESTCYKGHYPDTIRFRNGKFHFYLR